MPPELLAHVSRAVESYRAEHTGMSAKSEGAAPAAQAAPSPTEQTPEQSREQSRRVSSNSFDRPPLAIARLQPF